MPVHSNSIAAYYEEAERLTGRRAAVFECIKKNGQVTDRQVMNLLGYREPNAVRPRITELIDKGLLHECGNTKCPVTGKKVRMVEALLKGEIEQFDFMKDTNNVDSYT